MGLGSVFTQSRFEQFVATAARDKRGRIRRLSKPPAPGKQRLAPAGARIVHLASVEGYAAEPQTARIEPVQPTRENGLDWYDVLLVEGYGIVRSERQMAGLMREQTRLITGRVPPYPPAA